MRLRVSARNELATRQPTIHRAKTDHERNVDKATPRGDVREMLVRTMAPSSQGLGLPEPRCGS